MDPEGTGHPNPLMARENWVSLDGDWDITDGSVHATIRVPFPIGSKASGVSFRDRGSFTYSRTFSFHEDNPADGRAFLHVGACDHDAAVSVNGVEVGRHRGGYSSFSLEVTDCLQRGGNILEIAVRDSHRPGQVRGKQTFLPKPFAVWYAGFSGIWQSVWLERSGPARIIASSVDTDWSRRRIVIRARADARLSGEGAALPPELDVEVKTPGGESRRYAALRLDTSGNNNHAAPETRGLARFDYRLEVPFSELGEFPWSPDTPNLYRITYRLMAGSEVSDKVESYFGMRRIDTSAGRLCLNGRPLVLRMALVQGYYPEGGYTPLSTKVMEDDIRSLKRMGFNGARIHEKIESPLFLYLCDRLGLLVTFEMPSFYWPSPRVFGEYETELLEIMDRDSAHPSGIAWVLFNETWGMWGMYRKNSPTREFMSRILRLVREKDPSRPVIDNSGWEHFDTDIVDLHHYLGSAALARELYARLSRAESRVMRGVSLRATLEFYLAGGIARFTKALFLDKAAEDRAAERRAPWFLSEYGGFGWYRSAEEGGVEDRIGRYTADAVDSGLFCGYCLTQLYDVGAETNGLLSFDRRPRVDMDRIASINGMDLAAGRR